LSCGSVASSERREFDMAIDPELEEITRSGDIVWLDEGVGSNDGPTLEELDAQAREGGVPAWRLDLAFSEGGPWAGVRNFLEQVVSMLPETLIECHAREVALVLPELRRSLDRPMLPLMEIVPEQERVRAYAADRAIRVVHGLVDLVGAWAEREIQGGWLLLCDRFDEAGFMVRKFLAELVRRKGRTTGLTLIVAVGTSAGEDPSLAFPASRVTRISLGSENSPSPVAPSQDASAKRAETLEREVGDDPAVREARLPDLIRVWREADPERALPYQVEAFFLYTSQGFYHDAMRYGEAIRAHLDRWCGVDEGRRIKAINKFFGCLAVLGEPERVLEIVETEGFQKVTELDNQGLLHYIAAMIYARYMPDKDLERAVDHLEQGVEAIERADMDEADRHFQIAFNRNGLALIRHFQKRPEDAIDLCRSSLERLRTHLDEDRHKLHKSVLIYNIAQVYRSLGRDDESLRYYSEAIELDPAYSEYYNERGGIYLERGELEEAERDFLRAIELSPPYPQVWTNLGQCYRRWGRTREAVEAYDRALDLDPTQTLALMGRADARQSAGASAEALGDYTRYLELVPDDWQALGNRAVLLFEKDDVEAALADLDRAVAAAPEEVELRSNRAVALSHVGRSDDAISDLRACLELLPVDAPSRSGIEERLRALGEDEATAPTVREAAG
jgi:tetratricopeptide (TPR) repeat protein